jgi:hypothetical protein
MPGFRLAKKAAEIFERTRPSRLGTVEHGIFTFGETAQGPMSGSPRSRWPAAGRTPPDDRVRTPASRSKWRRRLKWRRSCAAPAPSPIQLGRLQAFHPRIPVKRAIRDYANGDELPATAGPGRDPDHRSAPELPADHAGARSGRLDGFKRRCAMLSAALSPNIVRTSHATIRARRYQSTSSTRCRGSS